LKPEGKEETREHTSESTDCNSVNFRHPAVVSSCGATGHVESKTIHQMPIITISAGITM